MNSVTALIEHFHRAAFGELLRGLPRLSKDGLDVEAAGEGDADIAERFEKLVARPQAIELEAREGCRPASPSASPAPDLSPRANDGP